MARLGDDLRDKPVGSVFEVCERWVDQFWAQYTTALAQEIQICQMLSAKPPFNPAANPPLPNSRTVFEEIHLVTLLNTLPVGFCIGGYILADLKPEAYEVFFHPTASKPLAKPVPIGHSFWGMPTLINRLIKGCGDDVRQAILASGKWQGTPADLDTVIGQHSLAHPETVPIREAIDFTHACLLTTVGGPAPTTKQPEITPPLSRLLEIQSLYRLIGDQGERVSVPRDADVKPTNMPVEKRYGL